MKKSFFSLILLFISVTAISCAGKQPDTPAKEPEGYRFSAYVVSDIHLLSSYLVDESSPKSMLAGDGRCQELDIPLLEALVEKVNAEKPRYLIITGDLTFNGEFISHVELRYYLLKISEDIQVLVIPGNHDCNNLYSLNFENSTMTETTSLKYKSFAWFYKYFGYEGAVSYDTDSLSYIWALDENTWGIFLDTNLSKYNHSESMQLTGGQLSGKTMAWLKEQLDYAKEHGIKVISFSHHNLITHNPAFESKYTLGNAASLRELYSEYGVSLNMSGHLHIQSIKEQDGIYDIASGSLLDYGCRYGVLDVYDNAFDYNSYKMTLPDIDLDSYSFERFYSRNYDKMSLAADKFGNKLDEAKDFIAKANCYYFDGSYSKLSELINSNKSIYKTIVKSSPGIYIETVLACGKEGKDATSVRIFTD